MSVNRNLSVEEMKKLVAKHGTVKDAAEAIGIPRTTFRDRIHPRSNQRSCATERIIPKKGKTLADFRSIYDKDFIVPKKIKEALKVLGASWEYEQIFAKIAEVSLADLGNYRDQFSDHVVVLKESRRAWAGTKDLAARMRKMI